MNGPLIYMNNKTILIMIKCKFMLYLKYAKSADIAAILNSVSSGVIPSDDGIKTVITHHEKTNSLIISSARYYN